MPANRTQSVRVGCALSLLAGLMIGIILFIYYRDITNCRADMSPLINIKVTIDPSQDQQFIEQSRQFAFENNFRFDINDGGQGSDFRVRMIRKDVEILAKSPSMPGGYEIEFYNYDCVRPVTASDIADLVNDYKGFMSEIPAVTITE